MDKVELKPCPFCSRKPCVDEERGAWMIFCPTNAHHAGTDFFDTKAEAIAAWNTRPDTTTIEALQAQLREQALQYLALDGQATELQAQVAARDAEIGRLRRLIVAASKFIGQLKHTKKGERLFARINAALGQGEG